MTAVASKSPMRATGASSARPASKAACATGLEGPHEAILTPNRTLLRGRIVIGPDSIVL
jgi:hypothetical protein